MPAARTAPNDDPYSTIRCSPRCHQTRCGISCTSGCDPVAIDERQTGVSDGKGRRGAPVRRRARRGTERGRVGGLEHRRRQAVDDDEDDRLRPAVARERAQPRVAVGRPAAQTRAEHEARRAPRGSRGPARTRAPHRRVRRAPSRTAVPPRVPPRRSAPATSGAEPSEPQAAPTSAADRLAPPEDAGSRSTAAIAPRRRARAARARAQRRSRHRSTVPSPTRIPIEYQPPIDGQCSSAV